MLGCTSSYPRVLIIPGRSELKDLVKAIAHERIDGLIEALPDDLLARFIPALTDLLDSPNAEGPVGASIPDHRTPTCVIAPMPSEAVPDTRSTPEGAPQDPGVNRT